jgi:hypothetical protein
VPAQAYWEKTKKWFLDVIRYDKREILAAEMLPGFSDEPNTVTQYNVMKTLMNENWNFKNLDIVEFEVTSPVPMPANFPTPIQQQFTYKFIIRDNAHHEFESQVKWLVGQFRSFISSFYINRISTYLTCIVLMIATNVFCGQMRIQITKASSSKKSPSWPIFCSRKSPWTFLVSETVSKMRTNTDLCSHIRDRTLDKSARNSDCPVIRC